MPRYELTSPDLDAYVEANPTSLCQPTVDLCRDCTPDEGDAANLTAEIDPDLPPATRLDDGAEHPCYGEVYPPYVCPLCDRELTARDN